MTGVSTSLTSPQAERLAMVWEGKRGWTAKNLLVDNTKPVDSAVDIGIGDGDTTVMMPLTAAQARELAVELIIRADLIDPQGATS